MLRKWGVNRAPGTTVIEKEGPIRLVDSLMGGAVFVGACQKGAIAGVNVQPIECLSWKDFQTKCGDLLAGTYLPDAVKGYFQESRGNGRAWVVRVVDGTQTTASASIYSKDGTLLFTLSAKSPGAWGGRRKRVESATISGKVDNKFTLSTVGSTPAGFFVGGYVKKHDGTGSTYEVVLQNGSGAADITVRDATGLIDTDVVDIWIDNVNSVGVLFRECPQNPDYWDMLGYYNGLLVKTYEMLSLNPEDDRYYVNLINNDESNYWFTVTNSYAGTDYVVQRPYDDYGDVKTTVSAGDSTVTLVGLNRANPLDLTICLGDYVGGWIKKVGNNAKKWRIKSISDVADPVVTIEGLFEAADLSDGDNVHFEFPLELSGGFDGIITSLTTQVANQLEPSTSPIRFLNGKKRGLIKIATPGYGGDDTIAILGKGLAEALNFQYRVEATSTDDVVTFKNWCENTVGRSDFIVPTYPSWMRVLEGSQMKTIPVVGDVMGEESRIITVYNGYHKAGAGLEAVLGRCLGYRVSGVDYELGDEEIEYLNPAGINCLAKREGNFVIWGDRTFSSTSTWRWKHMREMMSHYEHLLMDSHDWIIFAINNRDTWALLYNELEDYFYKEYKKGALIGTKFEDACAIIIDERNNNEATTDDGELNVDISLRLVGTVERLVISIGRAMISERTAVAV